MIFESNILQLLSRSQNTNMKYEQPSLEDAKLLETIKFNA